MRKHKTVIIGAGPAGLRAAKILADNHEDFILLEARSEIYRKICTGMYGFSDTDLNKTHYFDLPESIFQKKINQVVLSFQGRRRAITENKAFVATINRQELSTWMYQEALKAGAKIFFDSPVSEINDGYLVCRGEKIFFDFLIGADGANSIARRYLKLKSNNIFALQYWLNEKAENIEIDFGPGNLGPYYAWTAPHSQQLSIGVGGDTRIISTSRLKENLESYCQTKGWDTSKAILEGAPIGCDFQGYRFRNIFLAGDAGGFASGLTGEGIYQAIASGEDIAKMIVNNEYSPVLINQLLKKKKSHDRLANYFRHRRFSRASLRLLFFLLRFKHFRHLATRFIA